MMFSRANEAAASASKTKRDCPVQQRDILRVKIRYKRTCRKGGHSSTRYFSLKIIGVWKLERRDFSSVPFAPTPRIPPVQNSVRDKGYYAADENLKQIRYRYCLDQLQFETYNLLGLRDQKKRLLRKQNGSESDLTNSTTEKPSVWEVGLLAGS